MQKMMCLFLFISLGCNIGNRSKSKDLGVSLTCPNISIDLAEIFEMSSLSKKRFSPTNRYTLAYVLDSTSCRTCVNRTINQLVIFKQENPTTDVLLITKVDDEKMVTFLKSAERMGRIDFPILGELESGSAGLGVGSHVSLFDMRNEVVLLKYLPDESAADTWPKVAKAISSVQNNRQN